MTRTIVTIGACATLLWAGAVPAAQTPEQKCVAGRAKAQGKYEACVQKWLAGFYAGAGGDSSKLSKCREKYAAVWTKLSALTGSTTCSGVARFTDNGTTVTDNLTGLVWEKKTTAVGSGANPSDRHDVDNFYTWSNSGTNGDGTAYTDFLSNLNSGGGFAATNDWRLPTFAELMTIAQPIGCTGPCIDATFGSTQSNYYWSATTIAGNPDFAWTVFFDLGFVNYDFKTNGVYVRAVRSGL